MSISSSTAAVSTVVSLWSETERPKCLIECNTLSINTLQLLQSIATPVGLNDFPHLLIHGTEGSGKHTIVDAIISQLSPGLKRERKLWQIPTNHPSKTLDIHTIQSPIHVHLNPSELGIHCDRAVIQHIVMKISEQQTSGIRILVLDDIDHLSIHAQNALRRTMETCIKSCRLILICRSLTMITSALRSRCCLIRVSAPSLKEVEEIMQNVLTRKSINTLSSQQIQELAKRSNRNLHQALSLLQQHADPTLYPTTLLTPITATPTTNTIVPDAVKAMHSSWTKQMMDVAELIASSPTRETMELIRIQVQGLLNHCADPTKLITSLLHELIKHCKSDSYHQIISAAGEFQYRLANGTKPMIHIEAFLMHSASIFANQLPDLNK
jgi:replication factor C subunit 3/5